MIEAAILDALQQSVKAAVAQCSDVTLGARIAFVDVTYDSDPSETWIELVYLPNNNAGWWGDEKSYRGTFRIILHVPIDGQGPIPAYTLLASIAEYYSKYMMIGGTVQITSNPDCTGSVKGDSDLLYAASLQYQRFSAVG